MLRALSFSRSLWLLGLAFSFGGCAYAVDWRITPAAVPDPSGPSAPEASEVRRFTAVTEGACSPTPELFDRDIEAEGLTRGTYCFWSLSVRTYARDGIAPQDDGVPCRLEALASTTVSLPRDGTIEQTEELVSEDARPSWDAAVATLVGCAPRRDPQRCLCPYSPNEGAIRGACTSPVRGEMFAITNEHVCAAQLGSPSLTCWGNTRGFTRDIAPLPPGMVGPMVVPDISVSGMGASRAVLEVEAGPGATCVRVLGNRTECIGEVGLPYDHFSDALDIDVGDAFVCAIALGDGDAGYQVKCDGGLEWMSGAAAVPTRLAASADELTVLNGPSIQSTATLTSSLLYSEIAASGDHVCAIDRAGGLRCWDLTASSALGAIEAEEFAMDVAAVSTSEDLVCVVGGAGRNRCGAYPDCSADRRMPGQNFNECSVQIDPDLGLITPGTGFICGVSGTDGTVHCQPLRSGVPAALLGHAATATDSDAVCPYPYPIP